jgi:glutathione S-transferase
MRAPIRLYRHPLSGHAHRVELMLAILGLETELVDVDLAGGEHRTEAFLAKSPFGQIPVIEDGDFVLADSAAILVYLALTYDPGGGLLPADPRARAEVQRFLSVAAGPARRGSCGSSARITTTRAPWLSPSGSSPRSMRTSRPASSSSDLV